MERDNADNPEVQLDETTKNSLDEIKWEIYELLDSTPPNLSAYYEDTRKAKIIGLIVSLCTNPARFI